MVSGLGAMACGSDEPPGRATCEGSCACDDAAGCACIDDCNTTCSGTCDLSCEDDAKCNGSGEQLLLRCVASSECKANVVSGELACEDSADCDLKTTGEAMVSCRNSSDCKLNLGPGSRVECADSSSCDVKCTGGCVVVCGTNASCALNCGPEEGAPAGVTCPDGTMVCGVACG